MDWGESSFWIGIGLVGNAAFALRFIVQWVASERAKRSVVPVSFWYLSLVGAAVLLVYAIHRRDPIFTLAYLPNGFIYVRNLYLLRKRQDGSGGDDSGPRMAGTISSSTLPSGSRTHI